jgi:hypothetical protein
MVLMAPSAGSPDSQAPLQLAIPRHDAVAAPISMTADGNPSSCCSSCCCWHLGAGRQVVNSVPALPVAGDADNPATMLPSRVISPIPHVTKINDVMKH